MTTMTKLLRTLTLTCAAFGAMCAYATPRDTYAIVASQAVMNDPAWKAATVNVLRKKYPTARLATWKNSPDETREKLAAWQPSFTAFVVKPEQAGALFTIAISHLCRNLDDDPYTDTFWGIITGYDAASARLLCEAKPIAIKRALDCAGCDLTAFEKAWRYTEDHRGIMNIWDRATMTSVQDAPCNTDNTAGVLERLQKDKIQFLSTSGHATQHDWQMGYSGPNMVMTHREGRLISIDTQKNFISAASTEPKVMFASGNCLIGDIDRTDCMALSWIRDGGARQFLGYTVTTWFGGAGWGTLGLYVSTAGLTTANEAFHFNGTGLVQALEALGVPELRDFRFTKLSKVNLPRCEAASRYANQQMQAGKSKEEVSNLMRQLMGNLHDRDTVAFYGDPALDARIANGRYEVLPAKLEEGNLTLGVKATELAQSGERTLWLRLPGSWSYDEVQPDPALGTPDLALDNMIRFPKANLAPGETATLRLTHAARKGR